MPIISDYNMKCVFFLPLFLFASLVGLSRGNYKKKQKNDLTIFLNSTLNFNKSDFTSNVSYTTCKNTFSQSLELNYMRIVGSKILIFSSLEFGRDKYKFLLQEPFNSNGITTGANGQIVQEISYAKFNVGVGCRFKQIKNGIPEIKIGQAAQKAFGSHNLYSEKYIQPGEYYYGRLGYLGNARESFAIELINSLYLGMKYRIGKGRFSTINVGIRAQRKFFMSKDASSFNYFNTVYSDNTGRFLGEDKFSGRHQSLSLVLGLTF